VSETINVDESLVQRLPLPLAKLVRRAQNAKTPLDRHQAAYYLWEASLKLLGSVAVVEYAELDDHDPKLVEMLKNLARPAVGHWWEFVRRLVPPLADSGDEGFIRVRELVLGNTRDDLPRVAGLDAAIVAHLQQAKATARASVQLTELFHSLVEYRNKEAAGHGALGMRAHGSFYDRMARALFAGMTELFQKLDVLAGRRLIYVGDVRRQAAGDWLVERFELIGESARRIESLTVSEGKEIALPRPERVYIVRTASDAPDGCGEMRSLSPLIHFQPEFEQVFFLNARRGKRQAEYLCYHDGEQLRRDLATDQRELLATVLKMHVDADDVAEWTARSHAEEPAPDADATAPAGGVRTIGEFELLSRLGQGGMGVVYRAWQPSLGRQVALKCMLKSGDPKAEGRFAREIRALGRVEHPGVVKVFTSGSEGERWFFAMELVEEADLARVCEQLSGRKVMEVDDTTWRQALTSACAAARSSEVPLSDSDQAADRLARARIATEQSDDEESAAVPTVVRGPGYVAEVVEIIRKVAEAADALHEAGIVHRDIKPGNIMLARDGKAPVLMDLGLAQLADETEGRLTRTRQFIGTLRYASPEQVLAATRVDRRSDVYGLGATLWELLTLRPLFGACDEIPTPELMQTILVTDPGSPRKSNPSVPRDLEAIVLKCLEKDKARRYATAGELAADLGRFLRNEPVTARLSPPWELMIKWLRRRPAIAALSAAVLGVALTGIGGVSLLWRVAVGQRDAARNNAYIANMRLAQREWDDAHVGRVLELLEAEQPRWGDADHRGFEWFYLNRLCHSDLMTLKGHTGPVHSIAFSPDGRRIASSDDNQTVKVWDASSGLEVLTLKGHTGPVRKVAFSPDGRRIASTSDDRTVNVWDASTGVVALTLMRNTHFVGGAVFSPDGRRIATGDADSTVTIWDATSGQVALSLKGNTGPVNRVAYSPDGRRIAAASFDGTVKVWDARSGRETLTLKAKGAQLAFSPDGRSIASVSGDQTVKVWDASTGVVALTLIGHAGVYRVAYSPDGRRIASADADRTVIIWDAASGQVALSLKGHADWVNEVAFSPDGNCVATASQDGTVKLWNAGLAPEPLTFKAHERSVVHLAFSPDGRCIASASQDGSVRVWDTVSGHEILTFKGHTSRVNGVAFSPDGRRIASASNDRTVKVWDACTGMVALTLMAHTGVDRLAYSPDGRRIASGNSDDGIIKIWDASSGQEKLAFKAHEFPVRGMAFSPDGRRISSTSNDGTVKVWDASSGRLTLMLEDQSVGLDLTLSPDGRRIAAAGFYGILRIWDASSGQETLTLKGPAGHVNCAAFSPNGRRIVSGGSDQTVRVWDAGSGQETLTLKGCPDTVWSVAFSPDGRRIACASHDGTIKIWDARDVTPESVAHDEASGLLLSLVERSATEVDLRDRVAQGTTRSPSVRSTALGMAHDFWANRVRRRAEAIVWPLFGEMLLRDDVLAALQARPAADAEIQAACLTLARTWPESAFACNGAAWALVRERGRSETMYERGTRLARSACQLEPGNGAFLNTLGVAQYRLGSVVEALATLTRSNEIQKGKEPTDLAFLAMTYQRLGKPTEARANLDRLRYITRDLGPNAPLTTENIALLEEAEAVVLLDAVFPLEPFAP
jgi:WD40 repeat protein/serine/threonine protein kinase